MEIKKEREKHYGKNISRVFMGNLFPNITIRADTRRHPSSTRSDPL